MAEREASSFGVRELARLLDSPPSSVQRTLESAQEVSLVSPGGAGQWELGWELFRIASLAQRKQPFGAATTILAELSEQTGETAVLAVYDRQRAGRMFVATSSSKHSVRFVPELFSWLPMHAGATALAILAHRPESERQSIYDKGLPALTKTTLTSPRDLERVLVEVLDKGFAVSHDEVDLGASALAAPVFSITGVTSSIAVIAPRQRFDEALERTLESHVVEAAARLGRRLGHPGAGLEIVS
jgi:DNA-binding IclR family transcriptional regulator